MAKEFTVHRSIDIAAPPERILPLLTDLRAWQKWSPWEGLDPALERTYAGAESGVGAVYGWRGNSKAGQGRMEIVEAVPHESIQLRLERLGSRGAPRTVHFAFVPVDGDLELRGTEEGRLSVSERVHALFTDLDARRGEELERGLGALRMATLAEVDNRRERDTVIREAEERARRQAPAPAP